MTLTNQLIEWAVMYEDGWSTSVWFRDGEERIRFDALDTVVNCLVRHGEVCCSEWSFLEDEIRLFDCRLALRYLCATLPDLSEKRRVECGREPIKEPADFQSGITRDDKYFSYPWGPFGYGGPSLGRIDHEAIVHGWDVEWGRNYTRFQREGQVLRFYESSNDGIVQLTTPDRQDEWSGSSRALRAELAAVVATSDQEDPWVALAELQEARS